ncbi:unnamed protein product [Adineta steineri]|uniref:Ionotropic glutamate receptor C-terminal domain-containing protein n=2 Tax=Adineta steineri TaxID=433720 RepID=A0A814VUY9_9BILA|nr:unnamed protein product [Adineta steineri]CAF3713785.1 unnamed protein product [Adineta steineri]
MLSSGKFRWLWLYLLFGQFVISYVRTAWPPSNSSNVQVLGIFEYLTNITESTVWSVQCRAMFISAILLSQQYNMTIQGQHISWQAVETGGDPMTALADTCQIISTSNIAGIVGSGISSESVVIAPFAAKIGIPVVSYASTDPALSDGIVYPTFYRTVPSDNTTALAMAQLFIRFNWTSCIIIYQNDEYGTGGVQAITDIFSNQKLIVSQMIMFDIVTRTIRGDLKSLLKNSSIRVIILWMDSAYSSVFIQHALDLDLLGPQFTWILTTPISLDSFNSTSYTKLSGMITVEPVPGGAVNAPINTTLLNAAYNIWQQYEPQTFPGANNVDFYAIFAFDATWSLIQGLNQLCSSFPNISSTCITFTGDSFCFDRRFVNSGTFMNVLDNTSFLGVSGPIQFSNTSTDRINGTYYIARNIQHSSSSLNYVPVLVWSDSNGWTTNTQTNVIIWPGNSLVVPTGFAALLDLTLRIAVIDSAPFTMMSEIQDGSGNISTKLTGYIPDLIDELKNRMGFIPNITYFSANASYGDLINLVANGTFDLFIGDVTITAARREIAGFSSTIYDNSLRVVVRDAASVKLDLWSYLKPFSFKLWITILGATIYAGILVYILEGRQNEALQDRSIVSIVGMSMWFSSSTIMGKSADFQTTTAPGRILTASLYILSLILVAAYTANLASDLTLLKSASSISGIDDIKNGKVAYSRIGIRVGSSIEDYYLREVSSGSRNYYPITSKINVYDALLNGIIDATITDAGTAEYIVNNIYCNLTLAGSDFDQSAYGIATQKNWLYEQDLDVTILSLREAGLFDNLTTKWFETNICSHSSDTSSAMSIESMSGLFLTCGVISILAILFFIWKRRYLVKNYLLVLFYEKDTLIQRNTSSTSDSSNMSSEQSSPGEASAYHISYM